MFMHVTNLIDSKAAMVEPEDRPDPLDDYLRQWGLEMYISSFKEQAIDLETLQMLSETDIKELVPVIGHRAKLNTQIKMLRAMSGENSSSTIMEICEDSLCSEQCGTLTTYILQSSAPSEQQSADLIEPVKENITPDTSCELFQMLNSTNDGKSLLLKYKNIGLLSNADRRKLCNIIISNEIKDEPNKKITSSRLYEVAYDIPKIFSKENSSVYFIPYMSITPKHKISAKGKLLDCYRQRIIDIKM